MVEARSQKLETGKRSIDVSNIPTSLYRYYDQHGLLLYIGVTQRGVQRMNEHHVNSEWWPYIDHSEIVHFHNREYALQSERREIEKYLPFFNRQYNASYPLGRDIYMSMVNGPWKMTPFERFQALPRRRLPLIAVDGDTLTFESHITDASVTRWLHIRDKDRVRAVTSKGKLTTLVTGVEPGSRARIICHKKLDKECVRSASAHLGWDQDEFKPFVRSVQVELHENVLPLRGKA